jgi:hypothetical protein
MLIITKNNTSAYFYKEIRHLEILEILITILNLGLINHPQPHIYYIWDGNNNILEIFWRFLITIIYL